MVVCVNLHCDLNLLEYSCLGLRVGRRKSLVQDVSAAEKQLKLLLFIIFSKQLKSELFGRILIMIV